MHPVEMDPLVNEKASCLYQLEQLGTQQVARWHIAQQNSGDFSSYEIDYIIMATP